MKLKRILIGTEEICGLISQLSVYYKSKGFEVITISRQNRYFHNRYDIDPERFLEGWLKHSRHSAFYKFLSKFIYLALPKNRKAAFLDRIKLSFFSEFDIYINIWACFTDEEKAIKHCNKNQIKWLTIMVGDDFRNRWVFKNHFNLENNLFKNFNISTDDLIYKLNRMRMHEKYATTVFSVPDQSSLALRPYFHFPIPVDLSEIKFNIPENKILKVIHCPSDENAKGTSQIENVVEELLKEGIEFEFISLRNIPHHELMEILSSADILVDEIVFHGPGSLSFEAMASGCAVLTKHLIKSPGCFKPPVIAVDQFNLKDQLKKILNDRNRIKQLAIEGRNYVEKHNTLKAVADYFIERIEPSDNYDYYPEYFRNEFDAKDYGIEVDIINKATESVMECDWYKTYIKPGKRGDLRF